ncbi:MAG: DUF4190 domain-containing protein [Polyangiaceae bacterium]|nr:DUF4190 domain-containing protein [Polyangiaceae bacterium]
MGEPPGGGPVGGYGLDLPPGLLPREARRGGAFEPLAVLSLGLGIASISGVWCCGSISPLLGLGGIATGVVALVRWGKSPLETRGRGLAVVGLVLGTISVMVAIGWATVWFTQSL